MLRDGDHRQGPDDWGLRASRWLPLAPLLLALSAPTSGWAITFADGIVHVIDSSNSFPFEVLDGPGPSTTTVEIVAGGEIGTGINGDLQLFDSSIVIMSGGPMESE